MTQTYVYTVIEEVQLERLMFSSSTKHIWKQHFQADDFLSKLSWSASTDFIERFLDTKDWDLAKRGYWMKEVEKGGRTFYIAKQTEQTK